MTMGHEPDIPKLMNEQNLREIDAKIDSEYEQLAELRQMREAVDDLMHKASQMLERFRERKAAERLKRINGKPF